MSKNYEVLNELVPKTQELHRAIFDKGYEQGQRDGRHTICVESIIFGAERLRVYNELKDFAIPDDKQTMDPDIPYYYIQYDKVMKECEVVNTCLCKRYGLCFKSESDAMKAINTVGEDRVKKYYLGII